MLKSFYLGGLGLGLVFLLAACGAVPVDSSPAPVEEQAPPAAEVTQPEMEDAPLAGEKTVVEEKMVPTDEPVAELVEESTEEMAVPDEPAMAEAVKEEPAPVEAELMPEEVATAEPVEAPTAEAMAQPAAAEKMAEEVTAGQAGPTAEQQQLLASLTVKGAPPELFNEVWLNSDPLKLADLRGKVVIVEFWTFG
jgi:hypothetical protein